MTAVFDLSAREDTRMSYHLRRTSLWLLGWRFFGRCRCLSTLLLSRILIITFRYHRGQGDLVFLLSVVAIEVLPDRRQTHVLVRLE